MAEYSPRQITHAAKGPIYCKIPSDVPHHHFNVAVVHAPEETPADHQESYHLLQKEANVSVHQSLRPDEPLRVVLKSYVFFYGSGNMLIGTSFSKLRCYTNAAAYQPYPWKAQKSSGSRTTHRSRSHACSEEDNETSESHVHEMVQCHGIISTEADQGAGGNGEDISIAIQLSTESNGDGCPVCPTRLETNPGRNNRRDFNFCCTNN